MSAVVPNLSLIAAVADNRVIGRDNRLPWRLPADLAHFKRLTMGKPLLMGRRTWESLPGLLPGRRHLVLSRDPGFRAEGAEVLPSLEAALERLSGEPELMLIGGAHVYAQALPRAARLYVTEVHAAPEGDAFFPRIDPEAWVEVERVAGTVDARNPIAHEFVTYRRSSQ